VFLNRRIHEEIKFVPDTMPVIEYQKLTCLRKVPRSVMEDVYETITVPVIIEKPVVKTVQEPTGK